MSPKEEKQAPRYNNYSEPPPSNNQQPAQKSYQNNQNYNQQQQKRVNNLPPRFQNMNKGIRIIFGIICHSKQTLICL